MLEKMYCALDFVMKSKRNISNIEIVSTISTIAAHYITSEYALLIPNDKNITDTKNYLNIDGTEAVMEFKKHIEFGVRNVIQTHDTTQDVVDYFKENSIIIRNDEKINEYIEFARVAEELSYSRPSQYFERRNGESTSWNNISLNQKLLNEFWYKQTRDRVMRIKSFDFKGKDGVSLLIESTLPLPASLNEGDEMPPQRVINQISHELTMQVKRDQLITGNKPIVGNCSISVPKSSWSVFGLNEKRLYISEYGGNRRVNVTLTNLGHNKILWDFRVNIPHMVFMQRVADYYYGNFVN